MGPRLPRLRPDQWQIVTHPATEKYVANGRRWGKTTLGLIVAIAAAWSGLRVAWVVPTFRNSNPFWRAALASVRHLRDQRLVSWNKSERTMEFGHSGGWIAVYSDENIDAMRGEAFHIVLVDEAAMIREDSVSEVILPTLADFGGTLFAISTPKGRNWFYEGWQRGYQAQLKNDPDSDVWSWRAPTTANPSPQIRKAAKLAKLRIPNRIYQQEWMAEFVSGALDIWLPEWFDHQHRWVEHPSRQFQIAGRYLSFDTALSEKDEAAYSAMICVELLQSYNLHIREAWRDRVAFPGLVEEITRRAQQWNYDGKLKGVIIEDKGSGTSALQTLRAAGPEWLKPLLIGFQPRESKEQRGEQAAVWGKQGAIWLPAPAPEYPWLFDLEYEMWKFPNSEYKDQCDSLHQVVLFLENYLAVSRPPQPNIVGTEWIAFPDLLESIA